MNSVRLFTLSMAEGTLFCNSPNRDITLMKTDFQYSTDFYEMNSQELEHTCMHLLCLAGEGSFVFNERCYHIVKNDLVVIPIPNRVSNLAAHHDMQVEWFAADYKFLQNLLPSNNYSIGGSISLNQDPVIKLTGNRQGICLTISIACATVWLTIICSSTEN